MTKVEKFIFTFILLVFSSALYFAYNLWIDADKAAYESCLLSIRSQIYESDLIETYKLDEQKWKILNDKEIDTLFSKIRPDDCAKVSNPSIDSWNNKIKIALRRFNDGIEIFVWSNGSDGISQTEDDIVAPVGKIPPK